MQELEGLSLVVALSIVDAMKTQNIEGLSLKWPNDILGNGKKMAGILLEVRGDLTDYSDVVIGIGINVSMSAEFGQLINQEWIDANSLSQRNINRNDLLPPIVNQLFKDLELFEKEGFRVFQQRWNNLDSHMGKSVKIIAGKDEQQGIERGVNEQGALLLEIDGIVKTFHGGELSLRGIDEALA
jgi:BirA family biotin operon repressor/biotin-[acetyl-CoA-carboxylase] ligase